MKYFIILLFFLPVIIFVIFLIRSHFSRLKKTKTLLKKFGREISDNEKYELDRDIVNSNYIRLWPRQIVGISVKNVVRLDSKRILGNAFLKYGDKRNSILEGELITVLCAINNKKNVEPDTSSTVFSNNSIQVWPFDDKVIFIGGYIDNEDEINSFIKRCDLILF